jgi:DNA-binding NarL/FixJ family response regulator
MVTLSPGIDTPRSSEGQRAILDAIAILSSAAALLGVSTATDVMDGAASTGNQNDRATFQAGALSSREREVAALMASGKTNRQIAEALFISIATVERHASNIYTKLGVHSRSQVAVWAFARGLTAAGTG